MKKIVFLFLLSLPVLLFAQTPESNDDNCFVQYMKLFEKRGGNEVVDGVYDDVIISIRIGTQCDCYRGKVKVENKAIRSVYIRYSDGSYDLYEPNYKYKDDWLVVAGKSKTRVTNDDKLVDIFFPSLLRPKKKDYEKAPLPDPDDL
ncbi:MAG: hypothetical protein ACT6QS_14665 [Flavobacteriales bacterium]